MAINYHFPPSSRVNQTWNFRRNKNLINVNNLYPLVIFFCIFPQAAIQIRHQVLEENVWIPSMRNMCGVGHSESTTRIVSFVKDSCKKQQNSKCELCTNKKVRVQFGIKIVKAFWQLTATTVTGSTMVGTKKNSTKKNCRNTKSVSVVQFFKLFWILVAAMLRESTILNNLSSKFIVVF